MTRMPTSVGPGSACATAALPSMPAMPTKQITRRTLHTPSRGGAPQGDGRLHKAIATAARRRVRLVAVNDRPPQDGDTIRIVIADDHAVVRSGLRMLLDSEPDFEVAAEAGDV